jgi:hypothetical protein
MPSLSQQYQTWDEALGRVTDVNEDDVANSLLFRRIGIKLTNIDDIIPDEIKDQIQGYRLSFVKRNTNNSRIAGNWLMTRRRDEDDFPFEDFDGATYEQYDFGFVPSDDPNINFGKARVISPELFKFRPTLNPLFIQVNRVQLTRPRDYLQAITYNEIPTDINKFSKCLSSLIYRPGNSIGDATEYHEEGINLDLKETLLEYNIEDTDPPPYGTDPFRPYVLFQYLIANITAFTGLLNLYEGFKSTNLSIIGRTGTIANNTKFKGGDVFTDTSIDLHLRSLSYIPKPDYVNGDPAFIRRRRVHNLRYSGLYSPVNCSKVFNEEPVDRDTTDIAVLETNDFDFDVLSESDLSAINDITTILTFDVNSNFISSFPFRVYRSLKVQNESLNIRTLSTYLVSNYYDMPNDKGEIIALRGFQGGVYIQHRFTLFFASIKDNLQADDVQAYLQRGDLFDRPPQEILSEDKGYVGSVSKASCLIFKGNYLSINQLTGQIFLINNGVKEITANGNRNYFRETLDIGLNYFEIDVDGEKRRIDNPFISVGYTATFDKQYNRLLVTKKNYAFKFPELIGDTIDETTVNFNGEFYSINGVLLDFNNVDNFTNLCKTWSYNLDAVEEGFVCLHDYFPSMFYYNIKNQFSIVNNLETVVARHYIHNDNETKGLYYDVNYESYVDLIFNSSKDITKKTVNVNWISQVITKQGGTDMFKTFTHIMLYNQHQCSGIINLKDNLYEVIRDAEGRWNFNKFRDLLTSVNLPIIGEDGDLLVENLNNNKQWFEKSNFISTFIVVRFIYDNLNNDTIYLHQAKVKSIRSKR